MISFASLGSGSEGNSFLIKKDKTILMIDSGFNQKETYSRLEKISVKPEEITAMLISHEHEDHIRSASKLSKTHNIPIYCSYGTAKKFRGDEDIILITNSEFSICDLYITPVFTSHDANESCQFVVTDKLQSIGILTDTGKISNEIIKKYAELDFLVIEANHDEKMLQESGYPQVLKTRILSNYGHLSNKQTCDFLCHLKDQEATKVIFCHMSKNNNSKERIEYELEEFGIKNSFEFDYIEQDKVYSWVNIKDTI
ncbi:MAG: MBL fold metallo-hydrolase [Nitrosomonadales bacterium]